MEGCTRLTVRGPPASRVPLSADQTTTGDVGERGGLAIAQRDVDVLPAPRPRAREQRRHDAVARVQPRREVRDGDAHLDRRAVAAAGDVHEAELGLDHDVVAGALGVRARLAVAGDGGVDEGRVDLVDGVEVEAILLETAREIVLDENVTFCSELV